MEYNQFHYPSVNRAVDEIDAMLFSSDPSPRELDEAERLCNRWIKRIQEMRKQQNDAGDLV